MRSQKLFIFLFNLLNGVLVESLLVQPKHVYITPVCANHTEPVATNIQLKTTNLIPPSKGLFYYVSAFCSAPVVPDLDHLCIA